MIGQMNSAGRSQPLRIVRGRRDDSSKVQARLARRPNRIVSICARGGQRPLRRCGYKAVLTHRHGPCENDYFVATALIAGARDGSADPPQYLSGWLFHSPAHIIGLAMVG